MPLLTFGKWKFMPVYSVWLRTTRASLLLILVPPYSVQPEHWYRDKELFPILNYQVREMAVTLIYGCGLIGFEFLPVPLRLPCAYHRLKALVNRWLDRNNLTNGFAMFRNNNGSTRLDPAQIIAQFIFQLAYAYSHFSH
jgi:hypothetical protein